MHDPCEPHHPGAPHHAGATHHHTGPARILGRIHHHRTGHIAKGLPAHAGACPAGGKMTLNRAVLKAGAPVAGFLALAAVAPAVVIATDPGGVAPAPAGMALNAAGGLPSAGAGGVGMADNVRGRHGIGGGVTDPRGARHRARPEPISEPPTWPLLLLAAACCASYRRWFRAG